MPAILETVTISPVKPPMYPAKPAVRLRSRSRRPLPQKQPMVAFCLQEYLPSRVALLEAGLDRYLPPAETYPNHLHAAIRYAVIETGGKRLRPLLCMAAAELCGATAEQVLPAACAVEMIHAFSLVHDDLPAMDNDALRRGKPTCHVAFNEPTALLAGDALLGIAGARQEARKMADQALAALAIFDDKAAPLRAMVHWALDRDR